MDETIRQGIALIFQWIFFLGFSTIFCIGAFFNGSIAWRMWIRDEPDGPSFAPLLPGILGGVAVIAAPFGEMSERLWYLWVPLLLDFGSIPYFSMVIVYAIKERGRK